VLVLDEAEDVFDADYNNPLARVFSEKHDSKAWMNGLLEGNGHPVVWISNKVDHIDTAYLRRFTYCLEFPTTPRAVRRSIALQHLELVSCSATLIESIGSMSM
jgi:transitional endoplasmic reticulum ATPase